MPDHADPPVAARAAGLAARLGAAVGVVVRHGLLQRRRPQRLGDGGLHGVELVVPGHLLDQRAAAIVLEHDEVADQCQQPARVAGAFEQYLELRQARVGQRLGPCGGLRRQPPAAVPGGLRRGADRAWLRLAAPVGPDARSAAARFFTREAGGTLTAAGYAVVVTGDHAQLSLTIRIERPHLVLLDLVLPGADGIVLMGSVPELADLPVVFISGYGRDETIAGALKAGAADYLVKPFSPTELTARVDAALRRVTRPEPFALGELAVHYEEQGGAGKTTIACALAV